MSPILFYLFSALVLVFAVAVVANRNPVASALSLVVSLLGLAALFVGLNAYFIAAIQVLVYAGAVMVLFLFIIMLLNIQSEARRKMNPLAYVAGGGVTALFVVQLSNVLSHFTLGKTEFPPIASGTIDDVHHLGSTLFSTHNLPFQVIGVLILVSTIGVVVLSKRELK
ncbi:MAG: NADH-quinone oxidoreductase subunit J [Verrucomicrobia bacterium]|nr:NADH-quinone oxidoreductase subunit J [Verrucomicrobiota bacterium]